MCQALVVSTRHGPYCLRIICCHQHHWIYADCILSLWSALLLKSVVHLRLTIDFQQIIWYLAAAVQVQLCKYFIENGDAEREAVVWADINVLRYGIFEDEQIQMSDAATGLRCWPTASDLP